MIVALKPITGVHGSFAIGDSIPSSVSSNITDGWIAAGAAEVRDDPATGNRTPVGTLVFPDGSTQATAADAAGSVSTHEADTTAVHGIADTSAITGVAISTDAAGPKVYFGEDDPADTQTVVVGDLWVRAVPRSGESSVYALFVRVVQDDPDPDIWATADLVAIDPVDPTLIRAFLSLRDNGLVHLEAENASGSTAVFDVDSDGAVSMQASNAEHTLTLEFGIDVAQGSIFAVGLPSADPEAEGLLYTAGAPGPADPKALMVSGGPAA